MNLIQSHTNSKIVKPNVLRLTIKRLATKDGKGILAKHIKIGDSRLVDFSSVRQMEIKTLQGVEHQKTVVNTVDENGKVLGWIYAEVFFQLTL